MAFIPASSTQSNSRSHHAPILPQWPTSKSLPSRASFMARSTKAPRTLQAFRVVVDRSDCEGDGDRVKHAVSQPTHVRRTTAVKSVQVEPSPSSATSGEATTNRIPSKEYPDQRFGEGINGKRPLPRRDHEFGKILRAIPIADWKAVVKALEKLEAEETCSEPLSAYMYSNCINRMSKCRRGREALDMLKRAEERGVANM